MRIALFWQGTQANEFTKASQACSELPQPTSIDDKLKSTIMVNESAYYLEFADFLSGPWPGMCGSGWYQLWSGPEYAGAGSLNADMLGYTGERYWCEDVANPLWPSHALWADRSGSTLAQIMAWCLTAPSHYLNQCWLLIIVNLWHSPESISTANVQATILYNNFENYTSKITAASSSGPFY